MYQGGGGQLLRQVIVYLSIWGQGLQRGMSERYTAKKEIEGKASKDHLKQIAAVI